MLILQLFFLK